MQKLKPSRIWLYKSSRLPEALKAVLLKAQLSPMRCLMLEREAETPELKAILRQKLQQTRLAPVARQLNHQTALFVDTGFGLTKRLAKQLVLQQLDIVAMLAALGAPEVQIGAFATEARWIDASVNPVETALCLRQTELGWSSQAWKVITKLKGTGIQRLVLLSSGDPTPEVLACWQRYLITQPQALLCWVDVSDEHAAQAELSLPADNSRVVRFSGWSEHLLNLVSLLGKML